MKSKVLSTLTLSLVIGISLSAQEIVLSSPGPKHVVMEEFSGVSCSNCPSGHAAAAQILADNPGTVHLVAYAPNTSSLTVPNNGGADFRRTFADAFYTTAYGGSRSMPTAFINREVGSNNQLRQSRTNWNSMVTTELAKTGDVNLAAKSAYNSSTGMLTVDVEAYYLNDIADAHNIYVLITEDDLTSNYQAGTSSSASNPYVYKGTFRENITAGQWGDMFGTSATAGDFKSMQFTYDLNNAQDPIDPANANVVVFLINDVDADKPVINGISVEAVGGSASTGTGSVLALNDLQTSENVSIYPNPSTSDVTIALSEINSEVSIQVTDLLGKVIYSQEGTQEEKIILQRALFASPGMYLIRLTNEQSSLVRKLNIR